MSAQVHDQDQARAALQALAAQASGHQLFALLQRFDQLTGELPRLSSPVSMAFPPSDVVSADAPTRAGERWTIRTPLMALAGAHGPLPLAISETLIAAIRRGDSAVQDFLDLFQSRFLLSLYRNAQRHHPALSTAKEQASRQETLLDALGGLGRQQGVHDGAGQGLWLRHAGLLGSAPRSQVGLERLLADGLNLPVRSRALAGDWLDLSTDTAQPLARSRLGHSTVLGRRGWDPCAGVALTVGPLPLSRLPDLLPGGRDHARMRWLTGRHASRELRCSVHLDVAPLPPQALPPLGQARLGRNAWLQPRTAANGLAKLPPIRLPNFSTADA